MPGQSENQQTDFGLTNTPINPAPASELSPAASAIGSVALTCLGAAAGYAKFGPSRNPLVRVLATTGILMSTTTCVGMYLYTNIAIVSGSENSLKSVPLVTDVIGSPLGAAGAAIGDALDGAKGLERGASIGSLFDNLFNLGDVASNLNKVTSFAKELSLKDVLEEVSGLGTVTSIAQTVNHFLGPGHEQFNATTPQSNNSQTQYWTPTPLPQTPATGGEGLDVGPSTSIPQN